MNNQFKQVARATHEATGALNGTLVQLDYLQELTSKAKMTDKQH